MYDMLVDNIQINYNINKINVVEYIAKHCGNWFKNGEFDQRKSRDSPGRHQHR